MEDELIDRDKNGGEVIRECQKEMKGVCEKGTHMGVI